MLSSSDCAENILYLSAKYRLSRNLLICMSKTERKNMCVNENCGEILKYGSLVNLIEETLYFRDYGHTEFSRAELEIILDWILTC